MSKFTAINRQIQIFTFRSWKATGHSHTQTRSICVSATQLNNDGPRYRGIELLRDPRLNKGMAFDLKERHIMGIHGLLPPVVSTMEKQVERVMANVNHWTRDIDKYIYLVSLQDRNEKLFYKVLTEYIEELAPIVYTPTVGQACEMFGFIYRRPRGLYITVNDIGHVDYLLSNWPERNVKAVVVTDGERILGLGDLGSFGMGISIGKLSLYTAMGGVPPDQCLPVVLDVGTDNEGLLLSEDYTGLRHKRVRGPVYDHLIDEFVNACVKRFGRSTVIQFEDFANQNAFRLLEKYRDKHVTFNDDIQGTASVVVAGMLAAMKAKKSNLAQEKYLFLGAGEAAIGIANLLTMSMMESGLSKEEATSKIWMVDIDGLISKDRPSGANNPHHTDYVKEHKHMTNLEEICREVRPTVAIGAAAAPGAFTTQFLKDMATFTYRPVIFALSNPTYKAECTAEEAYTATEGRCIFASGSPFGPVNYGGKLFYPGQGNNAYIFPGLALGAIVAGVHHISDAMFLRASEALADMVTVQDFEAGRIYPPLKNIRDVSTKLAARIVDYAYKEGIAATYPEPEDKEAFVKEHQYHCDYDSFVPHIYSWPGMQ